MCVWWQKYIGSVDVWLWCQYSCVRFGCQYLCLLGGCQYLCVLWRYQYLCVCLGCQYLCLFGGCQYLCVLWRFQKSCVRLIDNRICKANFECERFLFLLPCKLRKILVKCRPTNDYLPVEVGNWKGVQRSKRYYNNWQWISLH